MRLIKHWSTGLRLLGLGLSVFAVYTAFSLSVAHLNGISICPMVLGYPACVIVLICYFLITIAWGMALTKNIGHWPLVIFLIGFFPALLLALIGSTGEVFGFANCPVTENGFPKCFISLAFLIAMAVGWGVSSNHRKVKV